MDLQIKNYSLPEKISFNYEEMKSDLLSKVEKYKMMVYSDDQIKEAKADKAGLNKLKKTLNDERIKQEKEYMKPFTEFKQKINEIIKIIDEPIAVIDDQIMAYEEKKKLAKREAIKKLYSNMNHPVFLTIEMIFNHKWLNSSVSMKSVEDEITARLLNIKQDIKTIESLDEFSFEAMEVYKQTLDLNHAIAEGKRLSEIQKRKEEVQKNEETKIVESKQIEQEVASGLKWVTFKALVTKEDIDVMMKFFDRNLIEVRML